MKKLTLFLLLFALGCSKSDDNSWQANVSQARYGANSLTIMALKGNVSIINEGVTGGSLTVYKFNNKGMISSVTNPDTAFCARYDAQGRLAYFRTTGTESTIKYSDHDKYIYIGNDAQDYLPIFWKGVSEVSSTTQSETTTKNYNGANVTISGGTTLAGTITFNGEFPAKESFNAFNYTNFEYAAHTKNIVSISSTLGNTSKTDIYKDNKYNSLSETSLSVGTTRLSTTNVYNEDGILARWKTTVYSGEAITNETITTNQYTAYDQNGNWTENTKRTTSNPGAEQPIKRNYVYR